MKRRLMLHAGGDAGSALDEMREHLGGARRALFLPYAGHDLDAYTDSARERFAAVGIELVAAHRVDHIVAAAAAADAVIVGGGNSFRLVRALHDLGLIDLVRELVAAGVPYFGASAGANVACPTVRTTNDMPIVQPPSLDAFALVPFQINPHYMDPPPPEQRVGETRAERLAEFLDENDVPVVALREHSWLRVLDDTMQLRGTAGAVLFRRSGEPAELEPGADLSSLLFEDPEYDAPR